MKRERGKINIALFPGPKTREEYIYCNLCHRNLVSFDDNTLICPNCGQKHEIKKSGDINSAGLKQKNPPISKRNSFVISQDRKKKSDSSNKEELQQIVSGGFITDVNEIEL